MCNIEEKRPGTILHGALSVCHSDAKQNLRVAKIAGEGKELPEPNGITESRVCVTLRWLRLSKIYRALGSTDHEKWKGWWW